MRAFVRRHERLVFLDALRGVAAFSVAAFHVYVFSAIGPLLAPVLPRSIDWLFRNGGFGVEVFFVISGIAIATSIGTARIGWGYVGRFALRRSIRLDPPYWATLALAVALLTIDHRAPSLRRVLAHVVYLQGFLGEQQIVSVFWTLTFEVQFYLVLVFAVMVAQRLGAKMGWFLAIVPYLLSLAVVIARVGTGGWFISFWYAFATGVATMAMLNGRLSTVIWAFVLCLDVGTAAWAWNLAPVVVALTALLIGMLGRAGTLVTWSGGRLLQWLGKRSYSLYLVHFLGAAVAKLLSPRIDSPIGAFVLLILASAVALLSAEALYRAIEAPAHRLSRSISEFMSTCVPIKLPATEARPAADQSAAG